MLEVSIFGPGEGDKIYSMKKISHRLSVPEIEHGNKRCIKHYKTKINARVSVNQN